MVQLAALALQPSTFDPVRSTLAGASLLGNQIQNATALQELRTAPERTALALENARRQNAMLALQTEAAQRQHGALADFSAQGGFQNPSALQALSRDPQLFSGALGAYSSYQTWQNAQTAQGAQRVLAAGPEGSEARTRAYREELGRALAERRIDQNRYAQMLAQDPSDSALQRLIDLARPLTSEPSFNDIMRMQLPGGGGQQPPVGQLPPPGGMRPPAPVDMGVSAEGFDLRDRFGLSVTPESVGGPPPIALPPPGGPRVYGWLGTAEAQTPPPSIGGQPQAGSGPMGSRTNPLSEAAMGALPEDQRYGQYFSSGGRVLYYSREGLIPADQLPAQGGPPGAVGGDALQPPAPPVPRPELQSSVPGVTLGREMTVADTPSVALNALTGGAQAPPPSSGPETVGQVVTRVLGGATPAQRARFWTLMSRGSTRDDAMKLLQEIEIGGAERTAAEQARGKALGEAQAGLPQAVQSGSSMINNIDRIIADPNLGWITGVQSDWSTGSAFNPLTHLGNIPAYLANIPNIGSSTSLNTTRERIAQVQGQAFLQAFQSLRGGGAISEQEGARAQAAITRLGNLAQDDAGYMQALFEARREIWDLTNLARTRAGMQPVPYQPHANEGQGQSPPSLPPTLPPGTRLKYNPQTGQLE